MPYAKRTSFWDEITKYAAEIPGPKYEVPEHWAVKDINVEKTRSYSNRTTFVDDIHNNLKRFPNPGPAKYSSMTPQKKNYENTFAIADRMKKSIRTNVFDDIIAQQEVVPGPGAYSTPHKQPQTHICKPSKSRLRKQASPGPNHYSPDSPSYFTFDKKFKKNPVIIPKLTTIMQKRKQQIVTIPGPVLGPSKWQKGYLDKVTKTPQFSIYYN